MNSFPLLGLLVLIAWQNVGLLYEANACSLLPGGFPKCFPDSVDYRKKDGVREIRYRLESENEILSFQVNKGRRILRLGQHWNQIVGNRVDVVECKPDINYYDYKEEYETKLFDYFREDYLEQPSTVIGEQPVTSYFVITKREVWSCRSRIGSYNENIRFKRIVTELVSKDAYGDLLFFDGIDVTSVPIPENEGDLHYRTNTAIVREVKYLHSDNLSSIVRFDGHLVFEKINDEDELSLFKPISQRHEHEIVEDGFEREVEFRPDNSLEIVNTLSVEGLELFDSERPGDMSGSNDLFTCKLDPSDKRLFTREFSPRWSQWQFSNEKGYTSVQLGEYLFFKYFVVTNHEIWTCVGPNGNIERRVMEYIGKEPIKRIEFYSGKDVWKFGLDSKDAKKSVSVRSIMYADPNSLQHLRLNALIKLIREEPENDVAEEPAKEAKEEPETKQPGYLSGLFSCFTGGKKERRKTEKEDKPRNEEPKEKYRKVSVGAACYGKTNE